MKSQAQYTIYALNDVETSATAPSNPYTGQVWQDTSTTPPTMKVWNGSEWKEQNGTDEIRMSVKTVTEKEADLETTVSGLSSTVSETTKMVETIEDDLGDAEENITSLQSIRIFNLYGNQLCLLVNSPVRKSIQLAIYPKAVDLSSPSRHRKVADFSATASMILISLSFRLFEGQSIRL